jgi:hypothetical protein
VPIIRRNSCIYMTLGTCYPMWMTHTNHPYRIKFTNINTVVSPDDGHIVARNMLRKEINQEKLCTKLALFTRLYRDARLTKHKIIESCLN